MDPQEFEEQVGKDARSQLCRRLQDRLEARFASSEGDSLQGGPASHDERAVKVVEMTGCGDSFEVYIVSDVFEGKRLLERHAIVNEAVGDLMQEIHALSIRKTKTTAEIAREP